MINKTIPISETVEVEFDVELCDILQLISDEDLVEELSKRNIYLDVINAGPMLCNMLGLNKCESKERILEELNEYL